MYLWNTMKIREVFIFIIGIAICSPVYSKFCPRRTSGDKDKYEVAERFAKFSKSVPSMSVKHEHERTSRDKTDSYEYTIDVCPMLENDVAVRQHDITTNKDIKLGIGNRSILVGGVDWMMALYRGGDKYNGHCDNQPREAWLLIQCEEGSRKRELRVIEENRWKKGDGKEHGVCYYLFEVNHAAACSSESVKRERKLSGGTIFCIIFASLILAYIIFGLLYMRFVAGAKGFEQIPNYSFWREVGSLAADGCDFVCRRPNHPANTYKGMADALNIDSSDDEKDDQLLPM